MKNITKIITLLCFVVLSFFSNAQNGISTTDATAADTCNGSAFFADSVGLATYEWYSSDSTLISSTDAASGLCVGSYYLIVTVNGVTSTYNFVISVINPDPCAGFSAFINASSASAPGVCDATANGIAQGGTAPYTYIWDSVPSSSQIGNLCEGLLTLVVTDVNGCSTTTTSYIYSDSTTNWNSTLTGYVYPSNPSLDGLCDGSAYVDIYGGTAPYTFTHSNGDATQNPQNLCAGIYSVIVTDADSSTITLNYVVADPSDMFNGGNFGDSTAIDTLGTNAIEDCMIDYLTLDTAFVSDISYISNDSIVVTWSVVDGNGTISFLQSYTISSGIGVYDIILQIFCPQKTVGEFVLAADRIYFNPSLAMVDEFKKTTFSVYPNPFVNTLKIDLDENSKSNVSITDITGKVIFNSNYYSKNIEINVDGISKGQYFLTISNNGVQKTQIIVKQ